MRCDDDGFDTDSMMACTARLTLAHVPSMTETGRIFVRIADVERVKYGIVSGADTGERDACCRKRLLY